MFHLVIEDLNRFKLIQYCFFTIQKIKNVKNDYNGKK